MSSRCHYCEDFYFILYKLELSVSLQNQSNEDESLPVVGSVCKSTFSDIWWQSESSKICRMLKSSKAIQFSESILGSDTDNTSWIIEVKYWNEIMNVFWKEHLTVKCTNTQYQHLTQLSLDLRKVVITKIIFLIINNLQFYLLAI